MAPETQGNSADNWSDSTQASPQPSTNSDSTNAWNQQSDEFLKWVAAARENIEGENQDMITWFLDFISKWKVSPAIIDILNQQLQIDISPKKPGSIKKFYNKNYLQLSQKNITEIIDEILKQLSDNSLKQRALLTLWRIHALNEMKWSIWDLIQDNRWNITKILAWVGFLGWGIAWFPGVWPWTLTKILWLWWLWLAWYWAIKKPKELAECINIAQKTIKWTRSALSKVIPLPKSVFFSWEELLKLESDAHQRKGNKLEAKRKKIQLKREILAEKQKTKEFKKKNPWMISKTVKWVWRWVQWVWKWAFDKAIRKPWRLATYPFRIPSRFRDIVNVTRWTINKLALPIARWAYNVPAYATRWALNVANVITPKWLDLWQIKPPIWSNKKWNK